MAGPTAVGDHSAHVMSIAALGWTLAATRSLFHLVLETRMRHKEVPMSGCGSLFRTVR